jgi:hypothetical protein
MDQVHIGYTIWQDPPQNVMPRVTKLDVPRAAAMGVAIEGSATAWPGASGDPGLLSFDSISRQRHYIDIFNRGQESFAYSASADKPWILLSDPQGKIDKEKRIWAEIDWIKAPKGESKGIVKIAGAGGENVEIIITAFNPDAITRSSLDGFVESEGFVSMEAEHFTKNIPAGQVRWEKIEGYGRTLSAMSIVPMTARSVMPPKDAPCLEYRMYLFNPQKAVVRATVAPTLNFVPDRALRFAVSFDDQSPQIVDIVPRGFDARNGNREWEDSVRNACRVVQSMHTLSRQGYHTLKIWMVDPAVVLEKIVVDLGGMRPSYLGPPESYCHRGAKRKAN